jgi:hypothetical protein
MKNVNTSMKHPSDGEELQQGEVIALHSMQSTEAMKQQSQQHAQANSNLPASLALATTLCIDAGSDTAIALLVGSVATLDA